MHAFANVPKVSRPETSAKSRKSGRASYAQSQAAGSALSLQHAAGNHAVQRMPQAHPEGLNDVLTETAPSRGRIPARCPDAGAMQVEPAPGKSGDERERKEDRDSRRRVTRMPEPELQGSGVHGGARLECKVEQMSYDDIGQRADAVGDMSVPPVVHEALAGPGQPLDPATRAFMEPRFGWDFSKVRVHTDPTAAESAQQLGALGYAAGSHLVFAHGQFRPSTQSGQRLIAHELSHVVQQTVATSGAVGPFLKSAVPALWSANQSALRIGEQGDAREREAEQAAETAIGNHGPVKLRLKAENILQREPEPRARSRRRPSEADLRYMSRRPSFALHDWPRLDQSARDTILWGIISNYGPEFALQFREYANRRRQPNLVTEFTNLPSVTPRSLAARGYSYAGDLNGLPTWVHPSGREVVIVPRSQRREAEEEDERTPFERRCIDPCLLNSETEAECHECCARIPESDTRCRRACNTSCSLSLLL